MLSRLQIQKYILVDDLVVDFDKGLNVISGETGAGKSIIVSAISFVLGTRTDKNIIMGDSSYAMVEAEFDNLSVSNIQCLKNFGIDATDGVVISRKVYKDGKNDIRVNGQIFNITMLKQIGVYLLEIYGQHAYQVLLDDSQHIDFVDVMIGEELNSYIVTLKSLLQKKNEVQRQLDDIDGDDLTREREKQMLEYEINEIRSTYLIDNEDEILSQKLNKMNHTQKILDSLSTVLMSINTDNAASSLSMLLDAKHSIASVTNIDANIDEIYNRLNSVCIELDDLFDTTQKLVDTFEFDCQEYDKIDSRIDQINRLKRKYGSTISEILDYAATAEKRLLELNNSEEIIEELKNTLDSLNIDIENICSQITNLRQKAGVALAGRVVDELKTMGLIDARFEIKIQPTVLSPSGKDKVEFLFSANLGQKLLPLSKVISGGEMSRFMLAFDIIFGANKVNTLIFDEIDTGISGQVSHTVASKLYELSQKTQIIAITHLPALCAMADANYKVQKYTQDDMTYTRLSKLTKDEDIFEIARLAGSITNSSIAIQNAQELKFLCNQQKAKQCNG